MIDSCQIRDVIKEDLLMLLTWRNHPNVRRHMFTQHEIGLEEHLSWFAKVSVDASRRSLIIEEEHQPIGFVQLSQVERDGVCNWGFYVKPNAPQGTGIKLGISVLNYAFEHLKLHKICGQALETNHVSNGFHQRMGFKLEGILRKQQRIEMHYQDLHCYGLLATEWAAIKLRQESL